MRNGGSQMTKITRREFLRIGCSAAIAALAGGRLHSLAFAAAEAVNNDTADILIHIFLRGGIDGLNFCVPYADSNYVTARPTIRIKPPNQTRGALDLNGQFGLHPAAGPLHDLYRSGVLGIVLATGLPDPTRSHFDAMAMMERGTPGNKYISTGWIARHLASVSNVGSNELPVVVTQSDAPAVLLGYTDTATIPSLSNFQYSGRWDMIDFQRIAMRSLYSGTGWLYQAGTQALDISDRIAAVSTSYTPEFGAEYPNNTFGNALKLVAQLIKAELGLRIASVDYGGWDTHEYQGDDGQGYFADLVTTLARGLYAFYVDLTNYANRITIVVMSEFGRRLKQNASGGTDHGHGNIMLVLGGNVNGGLYGQWPGLAPEQLDEGKDLAITTDYRLVLSEIVMRRLMNPSLNYVFPNGPAYRPLGIVKGVDQPVDQRNPTTVYLPLILR